jgi:GMP synthase-like glutamine amidotransferase
MKVFIVNGGGAYRNMFLSLGWEISSSILDSQLICFTGGEDVSPSLYYADKHPATHSNLYRDEVEKRIFNEALASGIPMVGICRGGQFLNVMCGGSMYQHVQEHCMSHFITDLETGAVVYASSTHHQMIKPTPRGLLVASSRLEGAREWYEGEVFCKDVSKEDIEVVYYKAQDCLCFQPHPEFASAEFEGLKEYFSSLLSRYLGLEVRKPELV